MRKVISLNNNWYYKKEYIKGDENLLNLEGFEIVNLPHSNIEIPYNYFDEKIFQFISCYKYPLKLSNEFMGKKIFLHFEGVMAYAKVYLNGIFIGEHKGGYTPFDIQIDGVYDFDRDNNILTVVVDSTERSDIPPFGGQIDYLTYGGIYREVELYILDDIFIKNIKLETEKILDEEKKINIKLFIKNYSSETSSDFDITLREKDGKEIYKGLFKNNILKGDNNIVFEIDKLKGIKLWDIDSPNLYEIIVNLKSNGYEDEYKEIFGFRKAEFTPHGFYLNGRKVKLIGLNRHQSFPYVGYAMPKRVQEKDALILKNELHINIVRTSHYPQSKHFLNKCDEIGLLVFEEIPGWQHIGDDNWKNVAIENVKEMIQRDWNHPSIVLWGVRINESLDDDDFYKKTNEIAHNLDPTRQTGGVRYITKSSLLEDVYTMNDFIHDGINGPLRDQREVTGLDYDVPYMVTEFNGHMYPTKRFDNEERQMEHSLRHLRVQNASFLNDKICGAIGWCAFDYNTHKDFGSGDRICYHGVMDMFRIPKFASYVYKSQTSPEVEAVLEPVTFWARGERSIGGVIPLVVFTNCDYIEFKYGNNPPMKIYPNREEYNGISYPPVIIDYSVIKPEEAGTWGMIWEDVVFFGYFNGKRVIEKRFSCCPQPSKLYVEADDYNLSSLEKDATRIVVKILDQYDNILPFIDDIIKINIKGPARILGPDEIVLKGGAIAFWIETLNVSGEVEITVKSQRVKEKKINIYIK